MGRRLKFGDILEVETKHGLAYIQYVHRNEMMGWLVRGIEGFYDTRPPDLEELTGQPDLFLTFIYLYADVKDGHLTYVGPAQVPDHLKEFPLFRCSLRQLTGEFISWWLWDGDDEWEVGKTLTPEQQKLPLHTGIWTFGLLQALLEKQWRPGPDTYCVRLEPDEHMVTWPGD